MLEAENTLNRRVWGPWATLGFGLVVGIVFLVTQILVAGAFAVVEIVTDPKPSLLQIAENLGSVSGLLLALATIASAIVGVGLIIGIVKLRRSATVSEYLGLRLITRKTILVLLAVTAGVIILSDSLSVLLGRPINPEIMVDTYRTSVWPALLWIALVIFAPLFEEAFFRGFLFEGFRRSRIGAAGTIGLTALIWTLLHIQYGVYELATIFVLGILLGIVRLKTGSLWSPILMHAFGNLVATLEVALNVNSLVG